MNSTNATAITVSNVTTISNATLAMGNATTEAPVVAQSTLLAFGIVNLTLCSIASILCLILILATTLPLLTRKGRREYSTYNLYLAYLCIPDMAVNLFIAYLTVINTHWSTSDTTEDNSLWFYEYPYDDAIYPLCATANLYTNAFLVYEVFRLLKYSNLRKRYYPPTIGRVTKQAMFSYCMGLFIFVLDFYLIADRLDDNIWGLSPPILKLVHLLYWAFSWIFCILAPLSVLVVVSIRIYRQGLIHSTKSLYEGRLRVLTLFFLRIVFIDILIWMPCSVAYTIQWIAEDKHTKVLAYNISLLFSGIQVIINFGCALTKPDTKKLITTDLPVILMNFCKCQETEEEEEEEGDEDGATTRRRDPFLRTRLSSLRNTSSGTEGTTFFSRSIESSQGMLVRSLRSVNHKSDARVEEQQYNVSIEEEIESEDIDSEDIIDPANHNNINAAEPSDHSDDTLEVRNHTAKDASNESDENAQITVSNHRETNRVDRLAINDCGNGKSPDPEDPRCEAKSDVCEMV